MQSVDHKSTQQLAEQGDLDAQLQIGKLRLAQERYEEAASWFRRAADKDNVEAQCLLGSLLSEGLGVDQDHEASAYWLRKAAEQGNSAAQVLLAESFESGHAMPVNHALAAQWYLKAAELGDNLARMRYGQLLRKGSGVEKNLAEAVRWLRLAAESGSVDAQVELVECLRETPGASADEIMRWSKAAAEQGSATGAYLLGDAFERAATGDSDIAVAEQWYRKAAENGLLEAQLRLAKLYSEGKLVAQNQVEAEKWLGLMVANDASLTAASPAASSAGSAPAADVAHRAAGVPAVTEYAPGSIIDGKYFIVSVLGKGGMCRVYKAKHLTMNRMVAIKMLLPELAANDELVKRFQREAQAASALSHPNVITLYDLGNTPDGKPFIVMDYLEGEGLDQRIETTGRVPVDQCISMFIQVCAALDAAHEAGIIHRDIKPGNIMLTNTKTQTDVVKVVDFGLAKVLEPQEDDLKLTKSGQVFGTLLYMSPEQCLGHTLDARTDIYSVGCTMYEALTGSTVFSGNTPYDLMSKHINLPAPPIKQVAPNLVFPPDLERIVLKSLAKVREERYQKISEMQADLMKLRPQKS